MEKGMTIYAMAENLNNIKAELDTTLDWLAYGSVDSQISMEDIRAKQARASELQERYNIAEASLERARNAQRQQLEATAADPRAAAQDAVKKAEASFYRNAIMGNAAAAREATAKLGAIPEGDVDLGYGENLLPTNMSNQLVYEPFDTNPMRSIISMSQITNLELPTIEYEIEDDDFITDKDVARDLDLTAGKIVFGRFKSKVIAAVSDTVLYGTDTALVAYINNALGSGLCTKEKKLMFGAAPSTPLAHMNFYAASTGLKVVTGETMYDAIVNCLGDLHDRFAERAKVVMRRPDYLQMIRFLANNSATLFGAKPEDILGVPVVFCDAATKPIVADFSQYCLNYDIRMRYDSDRDIDSGDTKWVLTAWLDAQFKLKSAFRIAELETP